MRYGTPLYVYDADRIIASYKKIDSSIPYHPKQIHYAMMCNSHPEILHLLRDLGSNVQANSTKECRLAHECGYADRQISITTTNISSEDMIWYLKYGVLINFDSLEEIVRYGEIIRTLSKKSNVSHHGEIGIRVFARAETFDQCVTNKPYRPKSRVGIKRNQFAEAKRIAREYSLKIVGVHGYLASNVLDSDRFIRFSSYLAECAKEFEDLEYINFGAGFGIPAKPTDAEFDWNGYGRHLTSLMHSVSRHFSRRINLKIEPGRSLVGNAGTLLCEVTNIKDMDTWVQVGVNCGFGIFARPYIYGWQAAGWHDIVVANRMSSKPNRLYTICGNSVLQNDFLAEDRLLPKVMVGDILAIKNVGAYGAAMMSFFPGYEKPDEILVGYEGI
jgi:diaminopimelate decarboxylase